MQNESSITIITPCSIPVPYQMPVAIPHPFHYLLEDASRLVDVESAFLDEILEQLTTRGVLQNEKSGLP